MSIDGLTAFFMKLRLPLAASIALSTLLREARPMSLGELSVATGYAKSHLSAALRLLEERSLVVRTHRRGRRIFFSAKSGVVKRLVREHLLDLKRGISRSLSELGESLPVKEGLRVVEKEIEALVKRLEEGE